MKNKFNNSKYNISLMITCFVYLGVLITIDVLNTDRADIHSVIMDHLSQAIYYVGLLMPWDKRNK